ncbi:hypothetical protein [Actinomadura madurae]|uniref:hypothetical protein n=1 Tax=Actinomadura madurae TaxID=1993 RepID=UPI00202725BD|nr:hypothetical protein [Actinomadura madurae]MCP9951263.1 hypothetical protein [Actinomadura madurae]MCP9968033.1 hypothetical protein [Actinomadura madurae]MCP9980489.1 hypothetical protein [Actinomadura madurae]MCQ0007995.1 hypothetical protein [Actinomadura madurae]MCQ0016690.1 hypothetical protein [Actinomadura madurae]
MRAHSAAMAAVAVVVGAGVLTGCGGGSNVVEKSFTDRNGRACTYVVVNEVEDEGSEYDYDVHNIDCDYPPSPSASAGGPP